MKKIDRLEDFANIREEGAEKIVNNAKEKGGLSLLTWHHFKVKLPYYKKAAAGKFDLAQAKKEYSETYKKISLNMDQIEFQREVGRLEVLGELIIKEEKNSKKVNESLILSYSDFVNEKKKINPAYLTKDAAKMKSEIKKHAKKEDDDASAYTSHSKGGWKADYDSSGKRYKTKPSKYTQAFAKKYGKK